MKKYGFSDQVWRYIITLPSIFPKIEKIAIYGSRVMGNYKENSDIDLAIWGKDFGFYEMVDIREYLDNLPLLLSFDVTNMEIIEHEKLKDHIKEYGKIIYSKENSKEIA